MVAIIVFIASSNIYQYLLKAGMSSDSGLCGGKNSFPHGSDWAIGLTLFIYLLTDFREMARKRETEMGDKCRE